MLNHQTRMNNDMSDDDMRTQLTDFADEFMAEVQAEQRLKEVFEKHTGIAWVSKSAGNYEQMVESYIRVSAVCNIFRANKKETLAFLAPEEILILISKIYYRLDESSIFCIRLISYCHLLAFFIAWLRTAFC